MNIARVFPRRTKATPTDPWAFVGAPPLTRPPIDEVHISVAFSWDRREAERLAEFWGQYYPTRIGGPAMGTRGGDFEPGLYLKPGYVITSRGCPNRCWFCSVWNREGDIRELPITEGWNVLDDNILATSHEHFSAVCEMLKRQPERPEFTGGLDAALLTEWHVDQLVEVKPKQLFFAYDTPADLEPLREAARLLTNVWSPQSHRLRCYILMGYPGDTISNADRRIRESIALGFMPMAMLYRGDHDVVDVAWREFQREWARPYLVASNMLKQEGQPDAL